MTLFECTSQIDTTILDPYLKQIGYKLLPKTVKTKEEAQEDNKTDKKETNKPRTRIKGDF